MSGMFSGDLLTCAQRIQNLSGDLGSGDFGSGANATSAFSCLCTEDYDPRGVSSPVFWKIDQNLKAIPVITTVVFILFAIAVIWNSFIIIAYLARRQLLKEPGNIFLFNIAVADLLIALSTMLFSFVTLAAEEFVFGGLDRVRCGLCDFAGLFFSMLILFSTFALAALSIDRFIHLANPLSYDRIVKPWRAWLIVVLLWILALICGVLPVIGFGQYEFNVNFGACIPRFSGVNTKSGLNNVFYIFAMGILSVIAILILIATNVGTYRLVSKFLKRNFRRKTIYKKDADGETRRASKKHRMQQQQLVRVFSALLISTAISWTPLIVVIFLLIIIDPRSIPAEVYIFGWICYLTNPVFHPIVESFFVKDLRYQVRRVRRTIRKRATTLFKKSTAFFGAKDLDEANAAMDRAEETTMTGMDETMISQMTPSPTPEPKRSLRLTEKKFKKKITFSDELPSPHTVDVELKAYRQTRRKSPPPFTQVVIEDEEEEEEEEEEVASAPNGWIHPPDQSSVSDEVDTPEKEVVIPAEGLSDVEGAPGGVGINELATSVVSSVEVLVGENGIHSNDH